MALYVATSSPLDLAAGYEPLTVEALSFGKALELRKSFTLPHKVYVGSHEGCGCGFIINEDWPEAPEREQQKASVAGLRKLIEKASACGSVEVLVCFAGEEKKGYSRRVEVESVNEISVCWADRVLFVVNGGPSAQSNQDYR